MKWSVAPSLGRKRWSESRIRGVGVGGSAAAASSGSRGTLPKLHTCIIVSNYVNRIIVSN